MNGNYIDILIVFTMFSYIYQLIIEPIVNTIYPPPSDILYINNSINYLKNNLIETNNDTIVINVDNEKIINPNYIEELLIKKECNQEIINEFIRVYTDENIISNKPILLGNRNMHIINKDCESKIHIINTDNEKDKTEQILCIKIKN